MLDRSGRATRHGRRDRCCGGFRDGAPSLSRTLGILGTLVWDRIVPAGPDARVVEGWGGISYGISAAVACLGEDWNLLPIVKVGLDRLVDARGFLDSVGVSDRSALIGVAEETNRVELRYHTESDRVERLTGGVPGWSVEELVPALVRCDALLVNFVSGYEAALDTVRNVRARYDGPIYADLHSLFLGRAADGTRIPHQLDDLEAWTASFDAVQMNEEELALAVPDATDTRAALEAVIAAGPRLVIVTRGARGAEWLSGSSLPPDPSAWPGRSALADGARTAVGSVTIPSARSGDPTGCGDVWGAALFARLLAGDDVDSAARTATRCAARNVEHRGVEGLLEILRHEVAS